MEEKAKRLAISTTTAELFLLLVDEENSPDKFEEENDKAAEAAAADPVALSLMVLFCGSGTLSLRLLLLLELYEGQLLTTFPAVLK